MQKMRLLLCQLLIVGTVLGAASLQSVQAMGHESTESVVIPTIVKNYEASRNIERMLLTILRDKKTNIGKFVKAVRDLTPFLVLRVFECLEMQDLEIQTPVANYHGTQLKDDVVLVTVLRSGDALLEGFRHYFPHAPVGKILVQRDEQTTEAKFLYCKLPVRVTQESKVIILEPMIATGGSLTLVIGELIKHEITQENIIIASVVAAPEGLAKLAQKFPKISVTVLSIDEKLNEKKYIVPGLGDFGDRFYGTDDQVE